MNFIFLFENLLILLILYDGCHCIVLLQPPEVVSVNELVSPYIKDLLMLIDIASDGEYGGNLLSDNMMTSTCSNNKGEFEHVVNRGPVKKATHREKVSI